MKELPAILALASFVILFFSICLLMESEETKRLRKAQNAENWANFKALCFVLFWVALVIGVLSLLIFGLLHITAMSAVIMLLCYIAFKPSCSKECR